MALAAHIVGRASELGSVDRLLDRIGEGDPAALELVGEPGIGKTRLLAELAARADARGVPRPLRPAPASSSSTCRSGSSSTRSTSTSTASIHSRLERLAGDVRAELATVFPSLVRLATQAQDRDPARALPQPPRRLRAARDARADPAGGARARRRPLGAIPRRSSCSARSSTDRRPRRYSSRSPCGRGRCGERLARRGRTGAPRRHDRARRARARSAPRRPAS